MRAMTTFLDRLFGRNPPPTAATSPGKFGVTWELPSSPEGRLEAARWAYRTILLREPESREAIANLAANLPSVKAMRDAMLLSQEARAQPGFPVAIAMTGDEPAQEIQVNVDDAQANALFERVQAVWHALGETDPHWSVLTADEFRAQNIERTKQNFYAIGEANIAMIMRILARSGVDAAPMRTCMDFGCGVGRLTVPLASRFAKVTAVDVSASHLALARSAFDERGLGNVDTIQLRTIAQVDALPACDLMCSMIVLQHNPPPVMRTLLAGLLGRLNPGGAAVIQLPTYLPGYRFRVDDYLAGEGREMEMHALPQGEVFAVARAAGVDLLEVLEDGWTGLGIGRRSNTFVFRRPA